MDASLIPCSGCHRHILAHERECPFCHAPLRTSSSTLAGSLGAFTLAAMTMFGSACSRDTVEVETGGELGSTAETSTSTTTADESGSDSTESTGTDTDDTTSNTSNTSNTSGSFYAGPDVDFGGVLECDPFAQDCPEGEKCVPYASTGVSWDANKCVAVFGDGEPGAACSYGGRVEATDDCDADSHCWNVVDVNGQLIGECMAFCEGTADAPMCDMGQDCLISNDGSINLCLDVCDPLLQDCGAGLGCHWGSGEFLCVFVNEDNPAGAACDVSTGGIHQAQTGAINNCAPGLICLDASLLLNCGGSNCCTEFCALDDMNACPDPEVECASFFDEGMAPAGYENLGVCIIPGV